MDSIRGMPYEEFVRQYNFRKGTEEFNCGDCEAGYPARNCDPGMWCRRCENVEGHVYINEKYPGTICDLFKKRLTWEDKHPELLQEETGITKDRVLRAAKASGMSVGELMKKWRTLPKKIR